ncbi:hypothetical protein F5884DRAFT_332965 [Xylogone sp. PMI_703]|nr:hypothetical protein F5884DRAFT_332965 [Xylogone sp. PMI_703]
MSFSIPPPSTFLSLAPVTSQYFPPAPTATASASPSSITKNTATATQEQATAIDAAPVTAATNVPEVTEAIPEAAVEDHDPRARRSSSISSTTSSSAKRFLKLGPVFYGVGDGKGMGDWSEEVVADV